MTITRPCLRMILHLLQIFFTLGLTFICLVSPGGAADPWTVCASLVLTCTGRQSAHD
jgi:hypothetical protein